MNNIKVEPFNDVQSNNLESINNVNNNVESLNVIQNQNLESLNDSFSCQCGKVYQHHGSLWRHQKYECGKEPQFECIHCGRYFKRKSHLNSHLVAKHKDIYHQDESQGTEKFLKSLNLEL